MKTEGYFIFLILTLIRKRVNDKIRVIFKYRTTRENVYMFVFVKIYKAQCLFEFVTFSSNIHRNANTNVKLFLICCFGR